jgi:hypothetical protein
VSLKPSGSVTPLKFMRLVPLAAPKCAKTMVISSYTRTTNSQCLTLERLAMRPPRTRERNSCRIFRLGTVTASRRKRLSRRCHVWLHR